MGLSAPKKRTKISNDPNNLAWAKATDSFGHKILTSKGWKPGDYLGARDAAHAAHYTAANASSIRVTLREDGLGLGAQIGKGNAETFGLSMFSGLLGRLNGKSDKELEAQESAQRDVELRMYQSQKYGTMNFVYGGLLIGDKIEDRKLNGIESKAPAIRVPKKEVSVAENKKRKAEDDLVRGEDSSTQTKKKKKQKKEKRPHGENDEKLGESIEADQDLSTTPSIKRSRKSAPTEQTVAGKGDVALPSKTRKLEKKGDKQRTRSESDDEKSRLKLEKRARKEERRKRKEEKRRKRAEKEPIATKSPDSSSTDEDEKKSVPVTAVEARVATATGNRLAVRHRYIQQKRMASLNPQALKEIFMLQAAS